MLKRMMLALLAVSSMGLMLANAQEELGNKPLILPNSPAQKQMKDPSSYAVGFDVGFSLCSSGVTEKDIDPNDFLKGFLNGLAQDPAITPAQLEAAMQEFQQRIEKRMVAAAKANMERSNAYLDANKKKDGVQTTKSGLQYSVIKAGTGKTPSLTSKATVHYEGKTIDGTVFDSSVKRKEPYTTPVSGRIIAGWTEILQRMKVGDKWLVTIPPSLGYGERGNPPKIGPNEVLIFELELLDVN